MGQLKNLVIKRTSILVWSGVLFILMQTESMLPSLIAGVALILLLGSPGIYISNHKVYIFTRYRQWLFVLLIIAMSTLLSGLNNVSVSYLINFLSIFCITTYCSKRFTPIIIAEIFYRVALVSLLGAAIQFIYFQDGVFDSFSQIRFVFSDRNDFGLYLVAGFFSALYLGNCNIQLASATRRVFLLLVPCVMLLIGSRSALLALSVAFLAYAHFLRASRLFWLVVIAITAIMLILYFLMRADLVGGLRLIDSNGSIKDSNIIRLALLSVAYELFSNSPLFGIGPNMFMVKSGPYLVDLAPDLMSGLNLSDGLVTHNSYVQYFVELGIIAGLFVFYRLIKTISFFYNSVGLQLESSTRKSLAFLFAISTAFSVSGFFINIHSTVLFVFVLLGMREYVLRILRRDL